VSPAYQITKGAMSKAGTGRFGGRRALFGHRRKRLRESFPRRRGPGPVHAMTSFLKAGGAVSSANFPWARPPPPQSRLAKGLDREFGSFGGARGGGGYSAPPNAGPRGRWAGWGAEQGPRSAEIKIVRRPRAGSGGRGGEAKEKKTRKRRKEKKKQKKEEEKKKSKKKEESKKRTVLSSWSACSTIFARTRLACRRQGAVFRPFDFLEQAQSKVIADRRGQADRAP